MSKFSFGAKLPVEVGGLDCAVDCICLCLETRLPPYFRVLPTMARHYHSRPSLGQQRESCDPLGLVHPGPCIRPQLHSAPTALVPFPAVPFCRVQTPPRLAPLSQARLLSAQISASLLLARLQLLPLGAGFALAARLLRQVAQRLLAVPLPPTLTRRPPCPASN